MNQGDIVRVEQGHSFQLGAPLAPPGGQGTVFAATSLDRPGTKAVVKVFHGTSPDAERRLRFLIDSGASRTLPGLAGPMARIKSRSTLAYLAPVAPGRQIVDALMDRNRYTFELVEIATELCHLLALMEQNDLGHGDLHAANVFLADDNRVSLIDLDNFNARQRGLPPPPAYGHDDYMAAELREARLAKKQLAADLRTDRFALAVLLHRLLFLAHPAEHARSDPARFLDVMTSGHWPGRRHPPKKAPIMPFDTYGDGVVGLFERGFSRDPGRRPAAQEWRDSLLAAVADDCLVLHECGDVVMVDRLPATCAFCRQPVEVRKLVLLLRTPHETLTLAAGEHDIGRDHFKHTSARVSRRHLVIHFDGRAGLKLKHVGRNETRLENHQNNSWETLQTHSWTPLRKLPATLKLADLDLRLELAKAR